MNLKRLPPLYRGTLCIHGERWIWQQVGYRTDGERRLLRDEFRSEQAALDAYDRMVKEAESEG